MENTKNNLRNLINYMFDHPDENGCYFIDYWDDKEENPFEWKAVLNGPIGTPYEGGYYKLKITFEKNFPKSKPNIKFITKIYHCNISDNGSICLNLIKHWNPEKWNPEKTMDEILKSIYQMLAIQNPEDSYYERGKEYKENRKVFDMKAREYRDSFARLNQL